MRLSLWRFPVLLVGATIVSGFLLAAAEPLARRLLSPSDAVRREAIRELETLTPDMRERFVPTLMVALSDEHPAVRADAARLLKSMGIAADGRAAEMRRAVEQEKEREKAASRKAAMDEIQKDKEHGFPDLRSIMDEEKKAQAALAADDALKPSRGAGAGTTASLMEGLKDPDPWVRARSARRLSLVRGTPVEAIPALVDLLRDKDTEVRASAAGALGSMGPAAQSAVPALLKSLGDPDPGVRQIVGEALQQIQTAPQP
jgi:HEAT repeat protein